MTARKEMGVELITTKTTMNIKKNCPAHIFFTLFSTNIFQYILNLITLYIYKK